MFVCFLAIYSPHPYLFINADRHSVTFLGFYFKNGNLYDKKSGTLLESGILSDTLRRALKTNGVDFEENFDNLTRFV